MGSEDWKIKVEKNLEPRITKDLERMPREVERWAKQSIHKVPASITDQNKNAYSPRTVSLGPYHHGEDHLKAMEDHKLRAFLHSHKRSGIPISGYVEALTEVLDDLKGAYDQLGSEWQEEKNEEFLELMILDGCFILELLSSAHPTFDDYAYNDPIFSTQGKPYIVPYLRRDMLLLENQLPLLVLEKLVAVENEKSEVKREKTVKELILYFFFKEIEPVRDMDECLHILDVYRKYLLRDPHPNKIECKGDQYDILFSAEKLKEYGIVFQESKTTSLKDISFHEGVLKLPVVLVDDDTGTVFLNLIAFEQLHANAGKDVNSYIYFMGNIIKEASDVSLLHSRGVIKNSFGSNEAAADLFNSIAKDVKLDPESRFNEEIKKISDYCKSSLNAWRADIMQNYFRNPWVTLSVIAAILLFALTIIQTVFSVLSYINPKSY